MTWTPTRLLCLLPLPAGGMLFAILPSCGSDACDDGFLATNPAFVLPLDGAAEEGACVVYGYTQSSTSGQQKMLCRAASQERCDCYGGGLPDDYDVLMYSTETGELIDEATIRVSEAPAPYCRSAEVTQGFTRALRDTIFGEGGAGGAGGAGGGGGAGGAP